MSSPDPFQELVDSLKRVLLHPSSPPVCPAPAPPLPSTTPSTSSPIVFASPMARPAPFTGSAEECNGFLLQCTLTIDLHPQMFPTDQSKITFLITSLTGPALQWAETILNQAGPATQTFSHFLAHFREVFGSSPGDSSMGEQLFQLCQGTMPIHQYSLKFRTLAAASSWNEPSLLTAFRQGLNSCLRLQLAAYDDTYGLENGHSLFQSPSVMLSGIIGSHCHSSHSPPRDQWPSRTHANRLQPPIIYGETKTTHRGAMSVLWCEWPQDSGVSPSSSSGVGDYHTASHYQDESSIHLRSAHCWRFCGFSYHPPRLRFRGQFHRWGSLPAAPTPDLDHGDRLRDPVNNRQAPHSTSCQTQCWTITTANRAVTSGRTTSAGSGGFNCWHHPWTSLAGAAWSTPFLEDRRNP